MKRKCKNNFITSRTFTFCPEEPMEFDNGIVLFIESKKRNGLLRLGYDYVQGFDYTPFIDVITYVDAGDVMAAVVYKKDCPEYKYHDNDHEYYTTLEGAINTLKLMYLGYSYSNNFENVGYYRGTTIMFDPYLNYIKELLYAGNFDKIIQLSDEELNSKDGIISEEKILSFAIDNLQVLFGIHSFDLFMNNVAYFPHNSELIYSFYEACLMMQFTSVGSSRGKYPTKDTVMRIYNKRYNRYRAKLSGYTRNNKDLFVDKNNKGPINDIITIELTH
jgi:hypothetical protein